MNPEIAAINERVRSALERAIATSAAAVSELANRLARDPSALPAELDNAHKLSVDVRYSELCERVLRAAARSTLSRCVPVLFALVDEVEAIRSALLAGRHIVRSSDLYVCAGSDAAGEAMRLFLRDFGPEADAAKKFFVS